MTGSAAIARTDDSRPITVVHVIYKLDVGGLENGLVNLLNSLPSREFFHHVVCLTHATGFRKRILADNVQIHELNKREGKDLGAYLRLWRVLREIRPDIAHTRNLGTLDCALFIAGAGVRCHIHGEHGREKNDPDGTRLKSIWMRRLHRPFVNYFVAMSKDLQKWLIDCVGIPARRTMQLYNGVDTERFAPVDPDQKRSAFEKFTDSTNFVIGAVGRFDEIKDPLNLVDAFIDLVKSRPYARCCRLVYVGDGPLLDKAREKAEDAGLLDRVWFPGERDDVDCLMKGFDVFVLPSRGEGISNTVLEAMATGLPVIATRVGGNPELVVPGVTGILVDAADPSALKEAIEKYVLSPELTRNHGVAGRSRVIDQFSLVTMTKSYREMYVSLARSRKTAAPVASL